jgi:RHS repeat-associated protein
MPAEDTAGHLDYVDYMHARYYTPMMGRFLSVDPGKDWDPMKPQSWNMYAYTRNNPINGIDPDGEAVETVWDVVNIGMGAVSFALNVRAGNYGAAALDAAGIVVDSVATAVPFVPGGAGTAIKVSRAADAASTAVTAARTVRSAGGSGGGGGTPKGPSFVVTPGGTAIPVPKGATGPTPVINPQGKTTGSAYTGGAGGANGKVDGVRIMNPVPARGNSPAYPNGYVVYQSKPNAPGQKPQAVDPVSGKTVSRDKAHIPIDR